MGANNDLEIMHADSTISSFIDFFLRAFKQSLAESEVKPEELTQMEALLKGVKALFMAQLTMRQLMEEAGIDVDNIEN